MVKKLLKVENFNKILYFLVSLCFFSNSIKAQEKPENNIVNQETLLNKDWNTLYSQNGVSIYYTEIKDISCKGYKLKIINNTKENIVISFGVAGDLDNLCKGLYASYGSFQSRKIPLIPSETIIGSETNPALLIPNSNKNLSLEALMQNLTIQVQNIGK